MSNDELLAMAAKSKEPDWLNDFDDVINSFTDWQPPLCDNIHIAPPKQRQPKFKGVHAYFFSYFDDVTDFLDGRARDCGVNLTTKPPLRDHLVSMNGHDLRGPWYTYTLPMKVWSVTEGEFEVQTKTVKDLM